MAPVEGRTYATSDPEYALIYALGANMAGNEMSEETRKWITEKGRYGHIFEIDNDSLNRIQPDEDAVGEAVSNETYPWLNELAEEHLHRDYDEFGWSQLDRIMRGEYADWAHGGKRLVGLMTQEQKYQMIRDGASIANLGEMTFKNVWRIDKMDMPNYPDRPWKDDTPEKKQEREDTIWDLAELVERGGPGSGHHGHEGRPGEVGGSQPGGSVSAEAERLAEEHQADYEANRLEWEQDLLEKYGEADWDNGAWIGPSGNYLAPYGDHQATAIELMEWEADLTTQEGVKKSHRATDVVVRLGLIRYNLFERAAYFDIPSIDNTTESQWASMAVAVTKINRKMSGSGRYSKHARAEVTITIGSGIGHLGGARSERLAEGREAYDWLGLEEEYDYGVYRGGPGSGHHGHEGRPGEVGGSLPGEGFLSTAKDYYDRLRNPAKKKYAKKLAIVFDLNSKGFYPKLPEPEQVYKKDRWTPPGHEFTKIWEDLSAMAPPPIDKPDFDKLYPMIPREVEEIEGREIRLPIPNTDSIAASFMQWEELPGLRLMKVSDFFLPGDMPSWYDAGTRRETEALAEALKTSDWLEPLIVGVDQDGPWILEGSHRIDALRVIGAETFPALVVIDREAISIIERGGPGSGHHGHEGRPGEVGGSQPGDQVGEREGAKRVPTHLRPLTTDQRQDIANDLGLLGWYIKGVARGERQERNQPGDNAIAELLMNYENYAKDGLREFPKETTDTLRDVYQRAWTAIGNFEDWMEREGIEIESDEHREAYERLKIISDQFEPKAQGFINDILDNIEKRYDSDRRAAAEEYVNAGDTTWRKHQLAMLMADGQFSFADPRVQFPDTAKELEIFTGRGYDPRELFQVMGGNPKYGRGAKPYSDQTREMVWRKWLERAQTEGTGEWGFAQVMEDEYGMSAEALAYDYMATNTRDQWVPSDERYPLWDTAQYINDEWQKSTNTPGGMLATEIASEIWGGESIPRSRTRMTEEDVDYEIDVPEVRAETAEVLQTIYDNTQAEFADWGLEPGDTIRVFRGMNNAADERWNPDGTFGDATVDMWSLSSWTTNIETAHHFAKESKNGAIVAADIPIERILTTWTQGFPAKFEREYVVLGKDGIDAKVYFKNEGEFTILNLADPGRFHTLEDIGVERAEPWRFHIDEVEDDWIKEAGRLIDEDQRILAGGLPANVEALLEERGGPGSGHHGHTGRPGEVGGSQPGSGTRKPWAKVMEESKEEERKIAEEESARSEGLALFHWQDQNIEDIPKQMGKRVPEGMRYEPGRWLGLHSEGFGDVFREIAKSQDNPRWLDWGYVEEKIRRFERDMELERDQEWIFKTPLSPDDDARRLKMIELWSDPPIPLPPLLENARNLNVALLERNETMVWAYIDLIRTAKHAALKNRFGPAVFRGGPGSGHKGHKGRPGEVGGSQPGSVQGKRRKWAQAVEKNLESLEASPSKLMSSAFYISPTGMIYAEDETVQPPQQMFGAMFGAHAGIALRGLAGMDREEMVKTLGVHDPKFEFDDPETIMMEGLGFIRGFGGVHGRELDISIYHKPTAKQVRTIGDIVSTEQYSRIVWVLNFGPLEPQWKGYGDLRKLKAEINVRRSLAIRGGEGSGHHGHEGRPGEVGGSQPGEGLSFEEVPFLYRPISQDAMVEAYDMIPREGESWNKRADYYDRIMKKVTEQAFAEVMALGDDITGYNYQEFSGMDWPDEITKFNREDYPQLTDEQFEILEDSHLYGVQYTRERVYNWALKRMVALGLISPEDADNLSSENILRPQAREWEPLPDTLYHVTTAAESVRETGLKSRLELSMFAGRGLGGGEDDTLSFTGSLDTARAIDRALHEGRLAARDEFTIEEMIEHAKEGANAPAPYLGELFMTGAGRSLRSGHTHAEIDADWEQGVIHEDVQRWIDGAIERGQEKEDGNWDFYRFTFASARERSGGPQYPLFFGTDYKALAASDPADFSILEYKPVLGSLGYSMTDVLGEWRTVGGDAVLLVDEHEEITPETEEELIGA